ncbi:HlyD family secretion protein [Botrimarina hoheduenensis]|uniref:Hemolysin secretion protein D, chromosomal n=1 Tax=Botrimarina hoheduenensis TaxID=2528000 RepID=A0A5C5VRR2_9BACT|nr:HlyD family efflux transporter periplasmic adaptor subunit [Botrimarina hoheduenensis]TWT40763.1 Hemolysin secretion protein D, chromosomal [Botrimarina hoheduenensis]
MSQTTTRVEPRARQTQPQIDLEKTRTLSQVAYLEEAFPALQMVRTSRRIRLIGKVVLWLIGVSAVALVFVPWVQVIKGSGAVIALDPFERPQIVQAPVKGRIAERGAGVQEAAYVTRGQLLFRIEDQDPDYLMRLQTQVQLAQAEVERSRERLLSATELKETSERELMRVEEEIDYLKVARDELVKAIDQQIEQSRNKLSAARNKLIGAEAKRVQLEQDYIRQSNLFRDGIVSEREQQKSDQAYQVAVAEVAVAEQEVAAAEAGVIGKERERDSKREEYQAKIKKVEGALEKTTAGIQYAAINIAKTREEINQKESKLLDSERKLAVQETQDVLAPRDGYIMDLRVFDTSSIVKVGDQLCRIVPETKSPAVQVWVKGNDAPLIHVGDHARLTFEGWPAVQFSGWPSVAIGTFAGTVALVDPTDDGKGKFRVVIIPDETVIGKSVDDPEQPWPKYPYLRQGVRANALVLLDTVPLGWEVWRRMNGFPPSLDARGTADEEDAKSKAPKIKI